MLNKALFQDHKQAGSLRRYYLWLHPNLLKLSHTLETKTTFRSKHLTWRNNFREIPKRLFHYSQNNSRRNESSFTQNVQHSQWILILCTQINKDLMFTTWQNQIVHIDFDVFVSYTIDNVFLNWNQLRVDQKTSDTIKLILFSDHFAEYQKLIILILEHTTFGTIHCPTSSIAIECSRRVPKRIFYWRESIIVFTEGKAYFVV